jgi:hypothetical protein
MTSIGRKLGGTRVAVGDVLGVGRRIALPLSPAQKAENQGSNEADDDDASSDASSDGHPYV